MLNFPIPYQDELIYSTVARFGVHFGITSQCRLLTEVYGNPNIKVTTDLPHQLAAIGSHLSGCQQYDAEYLAYQHTLLPLYAPFVNEGRRAECLRLMVGAGNSGAIQRLLGMLASRVKQQALLKYCPQCNQLQEQQHGEYFWRRLWQVNGVDCCPAHGELKDATIELNGYRRYNHTAASPAICPDIIQNVAQPESKTVVEQVEILLNRPPSKSPEMAQWTAYYRNLADESGIRNNSRYKAAKLKERVLNCWSEKWLAEHGLTISEEACKSWLQHIYRKHCRSFNYLEHIVALQALLPSPWNISTVLDEVCQIVGNCKPPAKVAVAKTTDAALRKENRQHWAALVKKHGIKFVMQSSQNRAIKRWLAYHDRDWLLTFNEPYRTLGKYERTPAYWLKLDKLMVRQLLELQKHAELDLTLPQMNRTWYRSQLQYSAFIKNKVTKMPLCQLFFERYCEDTVAYQIRRITRVIVQLDRPLTDLKIWKVLRSAGLAEGRLKNGTREFLSRVIRV